MDIEPPPELPQEVLRHEREVREQTAGNNLLSDILSDLRRRPQLNYWSIFWAVFWGMMFYRLVSSILAKLSFGLF